MQFATAEFTSVYFFELFSTLPTNSWLTAKRLGIFKLPMPIQNKAGNFS